MADAIETPVEGQQSSVEMPNGVVLTGNGGDIEALREQFEERHEEIQPAAKTVEPVAAAVEEPQKEPRGRKRFDQLTAEREAEKRRADTAEAENKELKARLALPVQPVQPPAQPVAVETAATRTKPVEAEVGTKYQTYSDFVEDLADWKDEQREAKLRIDLDARSTQRIEADRASRTRASYVKDQVFPAGRAVYPDFDAVLKGTDKFVPGQIQEAILRLPNPEHAIYALAKDDSQIDGLVKLMADPLSLGIAVAQLMPREPVALPASTAPVVRTTNAPAPIQPVGAGSRTTSPTLEELAKAGNYDAYKAQRKIQLANSR